jgi:hypothetical protein
MVHEKIGGKTPFVTYYYEISLRSTNSKTYIDFTDSNRNRISSDADITFSKVPDTPLRQIKIINDGTTDYVRVGINDGPNSGPYIKIKFGESLTVPFVDTTEIVKDITIQASITNTTVRIIGLA